MQQRLGTRKTPDDPVLLFPGNGDLGYHLIQKLRSHLVVFSLNGNDEDTAHIGTSRTHRKMVRTIAEVMVGTVAAAEHHDRTELCACIVCKEIELRFSLPFPDFSTIEKSVEELCSRLCRF